MNFYNIIIFTIFNNMTVCNYKMFIYKKSTSRCFGYIIFIKWIFPIKNSFFKLDFYDTKDIQKQQKPQKKFNDFTSRLKLKFTT